LHFVDVFYNKITKASENQGLLTLVNIFIALVFNYLQIVP